MLLNFASGIPQQRCISLECGLQNGTLAVFVGTQLFGENMTYMVPTAYTFNYDVNFCFVLFLEKNLIRGF